MNNAAFSRSRGQILVLFVFALTVLLGFVALTVDMGMIFSDRRFSQNAADASSMAGASAVSKVLEAKSITYSNFDCTNTNVLLAIETAYTDAQARAVRNNIPALDRSIADNHGVQVSCTNLVNQKKRYVEITTYISSRPTTSFMQLFYNGEVVNTVKAVVRVTPRTEVVLGNAIMSLNTNNDSGLDFDGSIIVQTTNGGIFSNSIITGNGNFRVSSSGDNAGILLVNPSGPDINGNAGDFSPAVEVFPSTVAFAPIAAPNCGSGTVRSQSGSGNITPGRYSNISLTNGTLNLADGLYCISGSFDVTGGNVNGSGVTLYFTGNASFSIGGNANVTLSAPTSSPTGNAISGVLVYLAEGNTGNITMLGTSEQEWDGLVYAPDGVINIGGNSSLNTPNEVSHDDDGHDGCHEDDHGEDHDGHDDDGDGRDEDNDESCHLTTGFTQLVAHHISIFGNATVRVDYRSSTDNTMPPAIDLIH